MENYLPLLYLALFAILVTGGFLTLSHLLSPNKKGKPSKRLSYECGVDPIDEPRRRFSVKFYLVAMLFIVFDI